MIDLLLNESTEPLPPQEIIQWVKENLTSKFSPEERSSYSDIGYFLLILIIEKVIAKAL